MRNLLTRPLESYNKVVLGAVSLAVITVLLVGVVVLGKLDLGQTHYRGEFAQAADLGPGNQVTVAGVQVGTVERVELAGDHVVVTFNARKDVHMGADTRAAIKQTTILGSRYLQLSPAQDGVLERKTIPLANTEVPFDLQKTIAGATRTFAPVDAEQVVDSVRTLTESLQGLPEALPQALDNIESLATIMADRRDQLGTLLAATDTVTTMLRDQRADLGALVLQGRDVLAEIATRRAAVQRLFASASTLIDRVQAITGDEPAINQLLANVREFTKMIADHDALVRNILQTMPIAVRNVANATGSGNTLSAYLPEGPFFDSWMCAISGRARQFNLVEYFKDCS